MRMESRAFFFSETHSRELKYQMETHRFCIEHNSIGLGTDVLRPGVRFDPAQHPNQVCPIHVIELVTGAVRKMRARADGIL